MLVVRRHRPYAGTALVTDAYVDPEVLEPPSIPKSLRSAVEELDGQRSSMKAGRNATGRTEDLLRSWARLSAATGDTSDPSVQWSDLLGVRDVLLATMLEAEDPLRVWLVRVVDQIDEEFRHASELDLEGLESGDSFDPRGWWHRRSPHRGDSRH